VPLDLEGRQVAPRTTRSSNLNDEKIHGERSAGGNRQRIVEHGTFNGQHPATKSNERGSRVKAENAKKVCPKDWKYRDPADTLSSETLNKQQIREKKENSKEERLEGKAI